MTNDIRKIATLVIAGVAATAAAQWQGQSQRGLDRESVTVVGYDIDRDGRTDGWYTVTRYEYDRLRRDHQQQNGARTSGSRAFEASRDQSTGQADARRYGDAAIYRSGQRYDSNASRSNTQAGVSGDRRRYNPSRSEGVGRTAWPYHTRFTTPQRTAAQDQSWRSNGSETRYDQFQRPSNAAPDRSEPREQAGGLRPVRLAGQIVDMTTFTFAPDGRKHLVAKVRTDTGRSLPVHLGLPNELPMRLEQGDRVSIDGTIGRVNERRIVLADRVTSNGRRYSLNRAGASNQDRMAREAQSGTRFQRPRGEIPRGDLRTLTGTIEAVQAFPLPDGQRSVLAKVRTDNGRTAVVALGSVDHLRHSGADLRQGRRVTLLGYPVNVSGRQILATSRIESRQATPILLQPSPSQLRASGSFDRAYSRLAGAGDRSAGR